MSVTSANTTMNSSSSSLYLHCHVGSDEVIFAYSSLEPLFESLQMSIAHRFQLADAVYRYIDADGDICRIDSEQELREAINLSASHDSIHIAVTPTLDTPIPNAVLRMLTAPSTPAPPSQASMQEPVDEKERADDAAHAMSSSSSSTEVGIVDSDDESYAEARQVRVKTTRRGAMKHSRVAKSSSSSSSSSSGRSSGDVGKPLSTATASDATDNMTDRRVLAVDVGVIPDDHVVTQTGGNIVAQDFPSTEQHHHGQHQHGGAGEVMQQLSLYAQQQQASPPDEEKKSSNEEDIEEKHEVVSDAQLDVSDKSMSLSGGAAHNDLSFLLSAIFTQPQIQETLLLHENEVRQWMMDRVSLVQIIDRLSTLCTDPSAAAVFAHLFHRINLHTQTTCSQCHIAPVIGVRHQYQLTIPQQQVPSLLDDNELKSIDLSSPAATTIDLCNACYLAQIDQLSAEHRSVLHIDVSAPVDSISFPVASPSSMSPRSFQERFIAGGRRFAKNMSAAGQIIKDTTTPIITHVYSEVRRTVTGMIQRMTSEPSPRSAAASSPRSARRSARSRARLIQTYTDQLMRLREMDLVANEEDMYRAARLLVRFEGDIQKVANELIRLTEENQNLEAARQLEQDVPQMINPGISA